MRGKNLNLTYPRSRISGLSNSLRIRRMMRMGYTLGRKIWRASLPPYIFYTPAAQDAIQTSLSPLISFYLLCLSPLSSCGMNIGSSKFSLYRGKSLTYQLRLCLHYTDSLSCRHEKLSGVKSIPFYPAPNTLNNTHNTKQMQTSNGFRNTKKHPKSQATADNVFLVK